ncbi:rhodanese-related sulfurtransferase [Mucilaginibacter yixingensis]|uniref:Rhodanese-related sulfurtransferase n=1 Tax=Mucilaginibacter yixingensis TaxID=1295612 RepID=A0A2T5JFH0_9SPHI|nr:rhodanese-like domain-containing protein [Mucilaginibacter yixingensis]PTR01183.1 rhodanese-related sulfurtransferase [Mucilaginibacter yixingensis]
MSHNPNDIAAQEMAQRLQHPETLNLLDVREVMEYHTYNIGGLNIPLGKLPAALEDLEWEKHEEIIVICKAGLRSKTAQSILQQNGYLHVRNLTGGILALQKLK